MLLLVAIVGVMALTKTQGVHEPWFLRPTTSALSAVLFAIGVLGVLIRRDPLDHLHVHRADAERGQSRAGGRSASAHGGADGQALALFVMAVAAAEVAVGLAIIVVIFRAAPPPVGGRAERDALVVRPESRRGVPAVR